MQLKALALAATVLLTIGVGGAVAASVTTGPSAPTSTDHAQFADHSVDDVVDPDDRIGDGAVDRAATLALANGTVADSIEAADPHLEVWAPVGDDDTVTVWIAENESKRASLVVDVDLERETVERVDEPTALTAADSTKIDGSEYDIGIADEDGTSDDGEIDVEVIDGTADDQRRTITVEAIKIVDATDTEYGGFEILE